MEKRKDVPLDRDTVIDTGTLVKLGPVSLGLPSGEALAFDADSSTLITIDHKEKGKLIVIVSAGEWEGRRLGTLTQFTAAEARSFAASMLGSADQIDGGGVKH